jgi:hypothetical protein
VSLGFILASPFGLVQWSYQYANLRVPCQWRNSPESEPFNHSSLDFEGRIWSRPPLVLRLAIWRQEDAHWQVCGILQSNRETCG